MLFLMNTAGDEQSLTMSTAAAGETTASGYNINDVITGPRSSRWRSTVGVGGGAASYNFTGDVTVTHMVVARADWMLTSAGMRVVGRQKSSGGSWSDISGSEFNTLSRSDLVGPYQQDLVVAISPTDERGYAVSGDSAGTEATQYSKAYFSNAFDFDEEPMRNASWESIEDTGRMFYPIRGHFPYDTDMRITLNFRTISTTKVEAWKDSRRVYDWPMFIYDPNQTIFQEKLVHVLVEAWQERAMAKDYRDLEISFRRLRYYDTEL